MRFTFVRSAVVATLATAHLAPAPAGAQQLPDSIREASDTVRLETLVVTATRVPVRLRDAPGAVTVLTRDDLQRRGTQTVADALRLVPGLAVAQSAGPGAQTSVFMRGGESDYVQVLVDGVEVNDAGGAFNWAHLGVQDIERIEVVRGPASVLYGSDAVSGVVQVFTRSGGTPKVSASATAATTDRRDGAEGAMRSGEADVSLTGTWAGAGPLRAVSYGMTAAHTRSNGLYQFNSDYDNTLLSGRVQLEAGAFTVSGMLRHSDNTYHYPTSGSGEVNDINQVSVGDVLSAGGEAAWQAGSALTLRGVVAWNRSDIRNDDPADHPDDGVAWNTSWQTRRRLGMQADLLLPAMGLVSDGVLTVGAERERQRERTAWESVSEWGTFGDESSELRQNTGLFAQLHARAADVALTLGGRVDDNDRFGVFRTGRAALAWSPVASVRVHAAAGTAFKEPTFFEQFATGFTTGNPDLEPEQSRSVEAGATYVAGRAEVGAVLFGQRFRNLIQYTAAPAEGASNYSNIGEAQAQGLELNGSLALPAVRLRGAWTLTDTRVRDAGFGEDAAFQQDLPLLRRPRHVATAGAEVPLPDGLAVTVDVRYVGRRDDLDFTSWPAERVELAAYATTDGGLVWQPAGSGTQVTLRIRNLWDTEVEEIRNFPSAGRTFQLGVRWGAGL